MERAVRTALFVPGDRPDRFDKAAAAHPDLIIIDLEDAVAPARKRDALANAVRALAQDRRSGLRAAIRINQELDANEEVSELAKLTRHEGHGLVAVMVPKAERPEMLRALHSRLPRTPLIALIESAAGVLDSAAIAAVDGVERLALGAVDLAADLNSHGDVLENHARTQLAFASRAAGIAPPLDSPCLTFVDGAIVNATARRAREFGFDGQLCIHPAQIPFVRDAFRPSIEEIEWAHRVIHASEGASQLDGAMVDRPVIVRAQRILADAG